MRKTALYLAVAATFAISMLTGIPSASAASCMQFTSIQYNTPGNDLPVTKAKLNSEYVTIHNTCGVRVTLSHWKLRDRNGHAYTFPTTKVSAKKSIRVHTGSGTQNPANRYWGSHYYIWNNSGDRARLWHGEVIVDQCTWKAGDSIKHC